MKLVLPGLLASVFALSAASQTNILTNWQAGAWAEADFGPTVLAGHFTGGPDLDAVATDAGVPALLMAPEVFLTRINAPFAVNDMIVVPDGSSDDVLTVGSSGLVQLSWNATAGSWDTTSHDTSDWLGARFVRRGDLNESGELDVVGLGSGSTTVRVLLGSGGGYGTPSSFSSVFPAYGLELVQWDQDDAMEIAILSDYGIELYEADGTLVTSLYWTYSPMRVAVIGRPDDPQYHRERIAMVLDDPVTPDKQWLNVWDSTGIEGPFLIGMDPGVHSVQAADRDSDGDDDLFLNVTSQTAFLVLDNRQLVNFQPTSNPTFDPASHMSTHPFGDPGRDPSWSQTGLAIGDFDHDGDKDALAPAQGNYDGGLLEVGVDFMSEVPLARNDAVDHEEGLVTIDSSVFEQFVLVIKPSQLTLNLEKPTSTLPFDQEDEELAVVWSAWRADGLGDTIDPIAVTSGDAAFPGTEEQIAVLNLQVPLGDDTIFGLRIQHVVRDKVTLAVTAWAPSLTAIYALGTNNQALSALPEYETVPTPATLDDPNAGGNGQDDGGVTSGPRVPPADDDDPVGGGTP